ncbi:MAG: tRNA (adenosine(37)-N6)-threonylcarbamoyltransferase complex ATPase subunit type 1 TsaE [Anaerolineae bacterium]|nr:tRNA (adenosine(37)-N6)-threonylcarbamoyltransferase complex ATPase subunit type 1 TsaE [Anaerolineae bacterium]
MAILDPWTVDFVSSSEEQTVRLGVRLGELLQPGDLLCLSGDLGAGKTALARGVGRGWGATVRVTSPTYVVVNEYPRLHDGRILYHLDCYRLNSVGDVFTAGLEDILSGQQAVMVEWPERIEKWLSPDCLWVSLEYVSETRRKMQIKAEGERAQNYWTNLRRAHLVCRNLRRMQRDAKYDPGN